MSPLVCSLVSLYEMRWPALSNSSRSPTPRTLQIALQLSQKERRLEL